MISVGTEFKETVDGYFNSWLPAYDIVKDAIETRKENDPEGRLIMFETSGCPWKEHLFNIEEKLGIKGEILYVIYKNKETDWRIQVENPHLRGVQLSDQKSVCTIGHPGTNLNNLPKTSVLCYVDL